MIINFINGMKHNPYRLRALLSLYFLFHCSVPNLHAQTKECTQEDYISLIGETNTILAYDRSTLTDLIDAKTAIIALLAECERADFPTKDSLAYILHVNHFEISRRSGDIADMVNTLNRLQVIERMSKRYITSFSPDLEEQSINEQYGALRVKYAGEDMKSMAYVNSIVNGDTGNIVVEILPPINAWAGERNRMQNLKRITWIREQSKKGEFPLYFDAYDEVDSSFYFEIQYVPYLPRNDDKGSWYAITFDGIKRSRNNFAQDMTEEDRTIQLVPQEGWILSKKIPKKYVLLTFDGSGSARLVFKNKRTGERLEKTRYIRINDREGLHYYLPSDVELEATIVRSTSTGYKNIQFVTKILLGLMLGFAVYQFGKG